MADLGKLTEEQRKEHYEAVCATIGLDPKLGLLEYIWLDSDIGRKLVLYTLRGATDVLRELHKISITRLTKESGDGYVSYQAEGVKQGRMEIAIGAASIKGLSGRQLETAIMTAQTRAMRRLTLQFVGGGLLDESELPSTVTDIGRSGASLASLATLPAPPQPVVQPNTDAGKDITPTNEERAETQAFQQAAQQTFQRSDVVAPFSSGDITPSTVETVEKFAKPEVKKRRRRTKAEINFDSAESVQAPAVEMPTRPIPPPFGPPQIFTHIGEDAMEELPTQMNIPTAESAQQALTVVATKMPTTVVPEPAQERIQTTVFPPTLPAQEKTACTHPKGFDASICHICMLKEIDSLPAVVVDPDMPSEAEEKAWRARLFVYTNDILPKGGMQKADGIIWKIRKYVQNMFPELPVKNGTVKLNNTQWKALMNNLDTVVAVSKPEGLVKVIEQVAAKS